MDKYVHYHNINVQYKHTETILYICYLNQNHQFLVGLVDLGVLEILVHQGHQDYRCSPGYLVDLQPIRVELLNTGMLFF